MPGFYNPPSEIRALQTLIDEIYAANPTGTEDELLKAALIKSRGTINPAQAREFIQEKQVLDHPLMKLWIDAVNAEIKVLSGKPQADSIAVVRKAQLAGLQAVWDEATKQVNET